MDHGTRRLIAQYVSAPKLPTSLLAQDATGLWRTESTERGHLEIEFAPCGAALCGTILRARDPEGTIGPYECLGRQIVWDMMPAGTQGGWTDGKIWDPCVDCH